MENIEKEIRDYAKDLFYRYGLPPWNNVKAYNAVEKIVTRCMNELSENKELAETLSADSSIKYFVDQTILLML